MHRVYTIFGVLIIAVTICCCNMGRNKNKQAALVNLGRHLFYERAISVNNTKACASCHAQEFSFTDNYTRSIGALGDLHQRNAKPLINLANKKYFTAADTSITSLAQQMEGPMFNNHPVELGLNKNSNFLSFLNTNSNYKKLFSNAEQPITIPAVKKAIAAFISTITANNSRYDAFINGNATILTCAEKEGLQLFNKVGCKNCHGGVDFNTPTNYINALDLYQNIGLYNVNGSYPKTDLGLYNQTKINTDNGKFIIPTLRNLAFTAPYWHDGSANSLLDVLATYNRGGRLISNGINKGDGKLNPHKSKLINGLNLTLQQQQTIVAFLLTLTDSSVITKQQYANPFRSYETN
jgi:cytochrome c peroxidase